MDFLGIGVPEFLLILLIALIVFGPDRLPEVAAQAARTFKQLRRYATEVTGQFREEFEALTQEYEAMQEDLRQTQRELRELRESLQRDAAVASQELSESVEGVRQEIVRSIDDAAAPVVVNPEPAETESEPPAKVVPIDSGSRRTAAAGPENSDAAGRRPGRRPPSRLSGV